MDANGDGFGDFEGLMRRLDYLAGLGVTAIWLAPVPADAEPRQRLRHLRLLRRRPAARLARRLRGVHAPGATAAGSASSSTSSSTTRPTEHPWFRRRGAPTRSPFHDYYVWSKKRPKDWKNGMVFPGVQERTWTRANGSGGEYYYHRFYDFQPDLNIDNPDVRAEIRRIMGFWLELGVAGLPRRRRAVHHREALGGRRRAAAAVRLPGGVAPSSSSGASRDAILLGEANVLPDEIAKYFGERRRHAHDVQLLCQPARSSTRSPPPTRRRSRKALRATREAPADRAVGAVPAKSRRARSRPSDRRAAGAVFERFGPEKRDAALRPRHPPAAGADARRTPAASSSPTA